MPKKRSGSHHPRSGAGSRHPRLRAVRPPSVEIAGLRGPYLAWLLDNGLPAHVDPSMLWDDTVAVVDLAVRAGLTDLHLWTAEQIGALAAAAGGPDELTALPLFLAFLAGSGRWAGTQDQFDAALAAAEEAGSVLDAVLDELAEVAVEPSAEDAAVTALPVVGQAEALLRFLLPGRPVTSTGALRRGDVVPAAGLVGEDLGGRQPRSMWDVERLGTLWQALVDVGLLEVDRRAEPTPPARAWLAGDPDQARHARRLVVGGFVSHLLVEHSLPPWLGDPLDPLLPALAAAALGNPMPLAQALPVEESGGNPYDILVARDLLRRLADEGLVTATDIVATAPGLRAVLASVVSALLHAELTEDDPLLGLPEPDPSATGQAWRLRVELEGARPRIWREVLVDPGIHLDALHHVIQRLFDWEDYHLHEFTAELSRGRTVRLAPPEPDDDAFPSGEPTGDEAGVRLSQLLGPKRGVLRYRYDFGDCWDHRITVVGSRPADGTALPRCVDGAGAAPQEDSGGVWGWDEKVDAARDPRHPEHDDVRDWLGLAEGEALDPAAFDAVEVDERLADLRE